MDIEKLDINAVCFGILCNFTPVCGEERAKEAVELVRTLQAENEKLRAELKSKVDLVFQQAKELDRRHLLLQEQEADLEQVKRERDEDGLYTMKVIGVIKKEEYEAALWREQE